MLELARVGDGISGARTPRHLLGGSRWCSATPAMSSPEKPEPPVVLVDHDAAAPADATTIASRSRRTRLWRSMTWILMPSDSRFSTTLAGMHPREMVTIVTSAAAPAPPPCQCATRTGRRTVRRRSGRSWPSSKARDFLARHEDNRVLAVVGATFMRPIASKGLEGPPPSSPADAQSPHRRCECSRRNTHNLGRGTCGPAAARRSVSRDYRSQAAGRCTAADPHLRPSPGDISRPRASRCGQSTS